MCSCLRAYFSFKKYLESTRDSRAIFASYRHLKSYHSMHELFLNAINALQKFSSLEIISDISPMASKLDAAQLLDLIFLIRQGG